ncbi:aspartate/glutamate racemase family protein [Sphingorhabdus sp.]|jgi:aspartate racemase|uniref:aspartate/glutamate racemase family protein n=1 Tax=Sphingorhabdus sp. TaxID=1902408 RepID=UPI003BAED665|nr:amino acid racemase [Sphingomonadales bacterium]MBL0022388.1 amino acid racemase [Sphingomonadales bacterium]
MRKIGLIGGMSWYSTEFYYRRLNKQVQRRANAMCSAPLILDNLNFCDLAKAHTEQDWDNVGQVLVTSAKRLEQGGATAILIGANSMHKVYDAVAASVTVPVIHIADTVGAKMKADGIKSAALIGTRNVMAESWYRQRLVKHGVTLLPWEADDVDELERIIYDELMAGQVVRNSERALKTMLTEIDKDGADAVVLGCTELGMIVDTKANVLPVYDSAEIHADAGVEWIFGDAP